MEPLLFFRDTTGAKLVGYGTRATVVIFPSPMSSKHKRLRIQWNFYTFHAAEQQSTAI